MITASASGLPQQVLVVVVSFLGVVAALVFLLVRLVRAPTSDRRTRPLLVGAFLALVAGGAGLLASDAVAGSVALLIIGAAGALVGALLPRRRRS